VPVGSPRAVEGAIENGEQMPSNIEIKARVADLPRTQALVAAISDTLPQTLQQRDTFFRCGNGRLKLRELETGASELIFYDRANVTGAKQSDYEIAQVADPDALRHVLRRALGVTQVVEKTRLLYLVGQTRVHLDSVAGLGDFLELEVVLRPDQSPAEGQIIAANLMRRLGIHDSDLIATAYADMLSASGRDAEAESP
jgi:predicted adenylyl cyclase CyaB